MSALRLYAHYVHIALRAQLARPGSALLFALGQLLNTAAIFVGIWARFDRFGDLRGYQLTEIALFYGFANAMFAVASTATQGFNVFGAEYVKSGEFDRLLLRPRGTLLQLFGHDLHVGRLGRLLQAAIVFAVASASVPWDVHRVLVAGFAFAGGVALFCGIQIVQATLSFWTVETLEIINVASYGGVEAAQVPLDVYGVGLRRLLTFGVPLAAVSYYPLLTMLGRTDPLGAPAWVGSVSPLAGFVFFALSTLLWRVGVGHYTSSGS